MASTGVMLRRGLQADLISNPPVVGELVYATDLGMHGWLDETSTLVWKKINEVVEVGGSGSSVLVSSKQTNSNYYDDEILIAEWDYVNAEITLKVSTIFTTESTSGGELRTSASGVMTFSASEVSFEDYAYNTKNAFDYRISYEGDVRTSSFLRCQKVDEKTKIFAKCSGFETNNGNVDRATSVFEFFETNSGFGSREWPYNT